MKFTPYAHRPEVILYNILHMKQSLSLAVEGSGRIFLPLGMLTKLYIIYLYFNHSLLQEVRYEIFYFVRQDLVSTQKTLRFV